MQIRVAEVPETMQEVASDEDGRAPSDPIVGQKKKKESLENIDPQRQWV
jgi:hypothetical protein